jgi:hypothetical protein
MIWTASCGKQGAATQKMLKSVQNRLFGMGFSGQTTLFWTAVTFNKLGLLQNLWVKIRVKRPKHQLA